VIWRKLGVVYKPDGAKDWAVSHASLPTPLELNTGDIRLYLSFRDKDNVGRVGYVDVNAYDPVKILAISNRPVLDAGLPGTFDENGVLPTCVVDATADTKYLYYVGFELGTKIRYRLLTGLAVSHDGGETFHRLRQTPILERSEKELYFRCGPFVLKDGNVFKMWYVAGSSWTVVAGKEMPVYELKYLESADGISWDPAGKTCLDLCDPDEHGFGRPFVVKENGLYKLFYSIRRRSLAAYRLGYAESTDGINWQRRDHELGLDVSKEGWDSEAIMYSAVITVRDRTYMFYNGNNFGETGFGVALLERS
jgi:predicted GH43/DUF377 family glycosyl hydrolase